MAEVVDNLLVRGTSGKIGDQFVLRRLQDGRTILCSKPDFRNRKLSKDQKAHHARFKEAAAYARSAAQREPIYAQLAAGTMKNAYNVALGDWFNAPVIHKVEREGGIIRIQASDDVKVTSVKVIITNEDGVVLEQGEAVPAREAWWSYALNAMSEGKLKASVEARDLAGNVTKYPF